MVKRVFTIGSATMDVFVECDSANIVSVCSIEQKKSYMSYPYGAKIDMSDFATNVGGGGVNSAINFDNLGFNTTPIIKIGNDIYANGIIENLNKYTVNTDCIIKDRNISTGFSIILVSFQGDRTVLAHRGANSLISIEDIDFEKLKSADWLYIAPLNGNSNKVLSPLISFAKNNNIKVCFNAGTTSIKQGYEYMKEILNIADVVVMNKDEASMCTGIKIRPDTKESKYSENIIHPDIENMLKKLKIKNYQIVVITDGNNGAYSFEGKHLYHCPIFPSEVVSTLGAGDAFASTFFAALDETNYDIGKSLMYASIEAASVVSVFGATEGLIKFDRIKEHLDKSPQYTYYRILT